MNKYFTLVPLAMLAAAPAHATGGLVCRTANARPIEVAIGFGHVPGSPLILTRLLDAGRDVPVSAAQWWLDNQEVRLILIGTNALRQELLLRAGAMATRMTAACGAAAGGIGCVAAKADFVRHSRHRDALSDHG